jgi:exodeoxyribonuclease VII large subunit
MTQLADLDADPNVDVIVIARGGGSLEDLLPFSDEGLVRAVAAAHTPVVSAIGHEPDTPILDLVADLRASTPTDAAKRIVPDAAEELRQLGQARTRAHTAIANRLATEQHSLDQLRSRPVLRDPLASFQAHAQVLANFRLRLTTAITARLSAETASLAQLRGVLRSASPQATLRRGYSILTDASGATLGSVAATKPGATVTALLSDGELGLTVTAVTPDSHDSERP